MVKLPCCDGVTVSRTVVLSRSPPPTPETTMVYIPGFTEAPTVMVSVELPEPGAGIGFGLKVKVIGKPR
jgi:hypothetical protein